MSLISIIIPVYCNESSLPELARRLSNVTADLVEHRFEFIYVDDGSGDNSHRVLRELSRQDSRIRVVRLARNFGSNLAVLAGMTYAEGDCVGFIAADLQDPPETIPEMLRHWESGVPVVLAVRRDRKGDPLTTRIPAQMFNWLLEKMVFKTYTPQGVGFLLMDRMVAEVVVKSGERNSHMIGLVLWTGYEFRLVEYDRAARQYGKSQWTFRKKLKYMIDTFSSFSYLPLRIASALGLILSVFGGLYAATIIIGRLMNRITVPGWSALMVIVLLTSGTQLLILGIMGEYLWRVLSDSRRRPLFTVRSLINIDRVATMNGAAPVEKDGIFEVPAQLVDGSG